jgi:hypothetical protein
MSRLDPLNSSSFGHVDECTVPWIRERICDDLRAYGQRLMAERAPSGVSRVSGFGDVVGCTVSVIRHTVSAPLAGLERVLSSLNVRIAPARARNDFSGTAEGLFHHESCEWYGSDSEYSVWSEETHCAGWLICPCEKKLGE